ncbi:hypothetical protein TNCV_1242251 [Trichonephila clavipes]|nr:hypothetical protein TNCV_1242251 [Trichonephila clavipes]
MARIHVQYDLPQTTERAEFTFTPSLSLTPAYSKPDPFDNHFWHTDSTSLRRRHPMTICVTVSFVTPRPNIAVDDSQIEKETTQF